MAPIKCRQNYSEKSVGAGASVFKVLYTISTCSGASQVKGKKQRKQKCEFNLRVQNSTAQVVLPSDRCGQTSHEKARVGNHTLSRPTITTPCKESATWGLANHAERFLPAKPLQG